MAFVVIGRRRGPEMWASLPVVAPVTVRDSYPRRATDSSGGQPAANESHAQHEHTRTRPGHSYHAVWGWRQTVGIARFCD